MDRPDLTRRSFLALTGASAASLFACSAVVAGESDPDGSLVPADKWFAKTWLASLAARGEPLRAFSRRDELRFIGMPVGGIGCGRVLLSGDGRLWCWDIFNRSPFGPPVPSSAYATPPSVNSPFRFGFSLVEADQSRPLDAGGFRDIIFTGTYPVGTVDFADNATPLRVRLEAFTPFAPLDLDDSSLPCTVLRYRVTNTGATRVEAAIHAAMENAVGVGSSPDSPRVRVNRAVPSAVDSPLTLVCEATMALPPARPEIPFDDFETGRYEGWTATGAAFGDRPRLVEELAGAGEVDASGRGVADSRAIGEDAAIGGPDLPTGTLSSREFVISRRFIRFRIGGGRNPGQTCLNLLVDNAVVRTATGDDTRRLRRERWDVTEFEGRTARLQVVDTWRSAGGSITVDEIVLADDAPDPAADPRLAPDHGSMALALLSERPDAAVVPVAVAGERPVGELRVPLSLDPGQELTIDFAVAWHVPNIQAAAAAVGGQRLRRAYATRFPDASAVVKHVHERRHSLIARTLAWRDAWNDSTLPCWLLERAIANASSLAADACVPLEHGHVATFESAAGDVAPCGDAWRHAQSASRLFPSLERAIRLRHDFGTRFDSATGLVECSAASTPADLVDGLAASIVHAWRDHAMSPDDSFLRAVFPAVQRATTMLLSLDEDGDGLLELEADDPASAIAPASASLHAAAMRAAAAMAAESGDASLAALCASRADAAAASIVDRCFRDGWFRPALEPARARPASTGEASAIDQVLGQTLASHSGLARVLPRPETIDALRSIFRHNVTADVGPYRAAMDRVVRAGRWLAMPGEGGTITCTWPRGNAAAEAHVASSVHRGHANECLSGYEHLLASHLIAEGLVVEGLAVARLVHDRHHPSRRNPYAEVEGGPHAARAMASHATFISACGFRHHGSRGELSFEPRVFASPGERRFRCAFVASEGWGTYSQDLRDGVAIHSLRVLHGRVRLRAWGVPMLMAMMLEDVRVETLAGPEVRLVRREVNSPGEGESPAGFGRWVLEFAAGSPHLAAGDEVAVRIVRA
jgi:uncharacterized protein (DUF608 family)